MHTVAESLASSIVRGARNRRCLHYWVLQIKVSQVWKESDLVPMLCLISSAWRGTGRVLIWEVFSRLRRVDTNKCACSFGLILGK
jgi:hypothetical protein